MTEKEENTKNIEIALTLSGGGYRASIFHIGVLSYLYHLKLDDGSRLLDHITVMSTVSGGTITGMLYLLALADDDKVPKHLADMYDKIVANNLADYLLQNVAKKKNDSKLSIIKELGNVYDSVFFQGNTFQSLYDVVQKSHLHHYAAYATDISNALPFRFQVAKKEYGDVTIGNEVKGIRFDSAKKYRLADILAASSCFPIAFEPINFPRDFKDYSVSDEYAQSNMQTLLMDGGIIDNQGVDYLIEANKQMVAEAADGKGGIDLAIISDAASSADQKSENNEELNKRTWRDKLCYLLKVLLLFPFFPLIWLKKNIKFFSVNQLMNVLFICSSYWFVCLIVNFDDRWLALFFCILGFVFLSNYMLLVVFKKGIPKKFSESNQFNIPKKLLWDTNFNQYCRIISKRYESFSKVVSTVMMGHIRKKNIEMLTLNSRWTNRFVIPCISSLTSNGDWKKDEKARKMMAGAHELMRISDVASNFHSTLWFSKDDLDKDIPKQILACGQFSICYELNMWVDSHNGRQVNMQGVLSQLSKDFKGTLKDDWGNFKENPYMLVELNNLK